MKAKEAEYNRLMSEGLNKQAEQYKTLMDDMREDRRRLEEQHKNQLSQIDVNIITMINNIYVVSESPIHQNFKSCHQKVQCGLSDVRNSNPAIE